ncbi:MAG TPA: BTAD domain-containing putative transcriptional regulator [Anaerolineae bacterium]|nr:BTAD domain-containing putative transcriptional regulator [Anaerolineae bacterium]
MLEVRLLGRFEVRLDGELIDLASRPAQSLFAYLALNPNLPHRRERLAGLLWPDTSDANARNSLRHALWTLRRALGADGQYLLADDLTITLNADSDCRFDFAVLDQKPTVEWSADDLIGIVSEYGDDLLPGFYDEWVVLERQRLQVVFEHKMKLLLDRLVEARRWEDVLEWGERWIVLGYTPEPAYRALMVAHAGLGDVSKMAATFRRCVESLKTELGVEPSEQTRTTYEQLARGEAPHEPIAVPVTQPAIATDDMPPAPGEPPFKGLQYFDEADADLFFGRERLTARLVDRLRGSDFLAVVGASGSGKSSVTRAGLVPALKRGAPLADGASPPEGSTRWRYHVITPTAHPLEALALSLTRDSDSVTTTATLIDDLARDSRSLHLFVRRRLETQGNSRNSGNSGVLLPTSGGDWAGNHLLLVVDQFEELFTLCRDEAVRKAFIDNLLTAAAPSPVGAVPTGEGRGGGERPTIVVITLRADFYAHCAEHAPLRDALAKHQEYIGRMSAEELRRTIEEPAKRGGWQFEPGLVDLLMRETGSEPGGLPLLSHALLETWQRRRGRTLTLRSYAESGGVHGAIAKTAESVYRRFTPEQQAIARNVFIRLTELGEGTQDTRRRAALDELTSRADDVPDVGSVLNILAGARLITLAEETAEVAHEALIREWPTLRQWLSEDREGLRQHRHLTEAARGWEALGRDPGELYRGARLAQAVEWAETHAGELNALERAYLDASREWAEREAAEREAQQQRELEAARTLAETQAQAAHRLRLRNRAITAVGVIALILAVLAGTFGAQSGQNAEEAKRNLGVAEANAATAQAARGLADEQRGAALAAQATAEAERQRAETERRLAASRELAVLANSTLETDPELSILLALQALATTHTKQAEEALHRALQTSRIQHTLVGHTDFLEEVAYSPDGTLLATSGFDRTVRIWDIATGQERLTLTETGGRIAFHKDGTRLAALTPGENRESLIVTIWDVISGFTTGHFLAQARMRLG